MNYDFKPKDPTGLDASEIAAAIVDGKARIIERCLIGAVEQIEGRVPSETEVRKLSKRVIYPDGREVFTWRDVPILEVPSEPIKFEDRKVVFTIKTVFKDSVR